VIDPDLHKTLDLRNSKENSVDDLQRYAMRKILLIGVRDVFLGEMGSLFHGQWLKSAIYLKVYCLTAGIYFGNINQTNLV